MEIRLGVAGTRDGRKPAHGQGKQAEVAGDICRDGERRISQSVVGRHPIGRHRLLPPTS